MSDTPIYDATVHTHGHAPLPTIELDALPPLDECRRCHTPTSAPVTDEYGNTWCSDSCMDADSEDAYEQVQTCGWQNGEDLRTEPHVRWGWV